MILIWIVLGILLLFVFRGWYFIRWQTNLWKWHCKNIYPFDEKLTALEQEYVQRCIGLSWYELLRPFLYYKDPTLSRLSFFSYSHRITKDRVNAGRLAYGSGVRPQTAYQYALPVLRERKIELPLELNDNLCFGGLGWDLEEKTFRVYLRCWSLEKLPLVTGKKQGEGGIAWTFDEKGKLTDEKVYTFPEKKVTLLTSSQRGNIYQYDSLPPSKDEVPRKVQEILALYEKQGYTLDTYSQDKVDSSITLYFPHIS